MPYVMDHCSRGFVNHIVITGSETFDSMSAEDEDRFKTTLSLLYRVNPHANVILAPRGQFQHSKDFDVVLRDAAFDTRAMGKMRHLLYPGWWDRRTKEEEERRKETSSSENVADNSAAAAAAMGTKIWPHSVTSIAFKFSTCLDKKKLARELKRLKSAAAATRSRFRAGGGGGDDGRAATTGLIFIVTGEIRFEEGGKVSCLNYSAAADKLVCFPREDGDEAEKPAGGEAEKPVGGEGKGKAVEGGNDVEAKAEERVPRGSTAEKTGEEKTPPMVS